MSKHWTLSGPWQGRYWWRFWVSCYLFQCIHAWTVIWWKAISCIINSLGLMVFIIQWDFWFMTHSQWLHLAFVQMILNLGWEPWAQHLTIIKKNKKLLLMDQLMLCNVWNVDCDTECWYEGVSQKFWESQFMSSLIYFFIGLFMAMSCCLAIPCYFQRADDKRSAFVIHRVMLELCTLFLMCFWGDSAAWLRIVWEAWSEGMKWLNSLPCFTSKLREVHSCMGSIHVVTCACSIPLLPRSHA